MGVIRSIFDKVQESLFFIPAVVITVCIALGALALYADSAVPEFFGDLRFVIAPTIAGARSIVTTVAGATITVAAIVFSITALSTQIASNQYSPRAVKGFFEDRFQQMVIGFVVGTFSYSLVVLTGLGSVVPSPESTSSSISVTLAILFGVLSTVAIVAYIDHSLRRMQIDEVVRRIAEDTVASIRDHSRDLPRGPTYSENRDPEGAPASVNSKKTGWVPRIRVDRILSALPAGAIARVEVRPGEDGQRVYLPEVLSTSEQVHAAFAEIRLPSADQPYVIKTLVEILSDLMVSVREAEREGQEAAILTEARLACRPCVSPGYPSVTSIGPWETPASSTWKRASGHHR